MDSGLSNSSFLPWTDHSPKEGSADADAAYEKVACHGELRQYAFSKGPLWSSTIDFGNAEKHVVFILYSSMQEMHVQPFYSTCRHWHWNLPHQPTCN